MSGRDFFLNRYQKLGWQFKEVTLRQAIRINKMNTRKMDIIKRLESSGVSLEKIPFLQSGYWVKKASVSVGATAEYLLGLYSVQESASQIPASLFSNLRNKKVLDAAAAPGGKTVQLVDLMENSGAIVALDVDKRRLNALSNHLERCHVTNTVVALIDARQVSQLKIQFDRILLDVPCSGNFASDKDWFKYRTITDVERNAKVQREILEHAVDCLSPDGEIVYSTCSLEPEENELNMAWATNNLDLKIEEINCPGEKGLTDIFGKKLSSTVERCKRIWPGETQGFFICKLKRRRI
jgi:NOL1/NOP2/sun family putative RNA methylase